MAVSVALHFQKHLKKFAVSPHFEIDATWLADAYCSVSICMKQQKFF